MVRRTDEKAGKCRKCIKLKGSDLRYIATDADEFRSRQKGRETYRDIGRHKETQGDIGRLRRTQAGTGRQRNTQKHMKSSNTRLVFVPSHADQ